MMQSNGINVEELRSVVKGQYARVAERNLPCGAYTYPKNLLLDIDMGFGHVTVDTPLEYMKSTLDTVPVARVSTALRHASHFSEKAKELAKNEKVSLQIGDDLYELPRQFSTRNYKFSENLDYSGALPTEGVLYRFFVIEDDVQNILDAILNIRSVTETLRHYTDTFQADLSCFKPPRSGYVINPPKART